MTLARDLARFAVEATYDGLPPLAIEHARMLIASTVASAALGSTIGSSGIVRALAKEVEGRQEATAWFDGGTKLPVALAARLNATMSDAAASDDSDLRNILHHGTTCVSSSLAVAEREGSNGAEVLAAIVLGYEVAGRIGEVITPGFQRIGYHSCVIAIFAAAVAAGRLLRLGEDEMTHAIALAATSNGGIMAAANTSWAREHHAGLASMLGVEAALLAQKGYAAEEGILEAPGGYFEIYHGEDVGRLTRDLGVKWGILDDLAIKLVPGGHPYHAIAEAAAEAARLGNVDPAAVTALGVSTPGMRSLVGPRHPTDLIGVAHSPAYFLAAGVVGRGFGWEHAGDAKIFDPAIRRLLDLVEVDEPPSGEDRSRYRMGAKVRITVTSGETFEAIVLAPRGSGPRGIEWSDVEAKFRALVPAAGLTSDAIDACLKVIHGFDSLQSVSALTDLLR